jgi:hypothetical protein
VGPFQVDIAIMAGDACRTPPSVTRRGNVWRLAGEFDVRQRGTKWPPKGRISWPRTTEYASVADELSEIPRWAHQAVSTTAVASAPQTDPELQIVNSNSKSPRPADGEFGGQG